MTTKENINQHFTEIIHKNLPGKRGTLAVVGWFIDDQEEIVPYGDFGSHAPETTSFQIGSVTKLFTATLAAILAQDHQLDIKAQVGDYLELAPGSTVNGVVIEDLLTHHAGLPSATKALLGKYKHSNPYQHVSRQRLLDYLNTYKKRIKPNSGFQYSNLGFGVVGLILEAVTRKPYHTLVEDEICQPLDMTDLWITQPKYDIHLAPGAKFWKKETPRWELNAIAPAGGIDAHMIDMLKYARANIPGHPFYPKCEIAHQTGRSISKHLKIGLGWLITSHEGLGTLHSHTGATGGFNSFLGVHPAGRFGVVVLTNCRLSFFQELGLKMDAASGIGFEGLKVIAKEVEKA